MENEIPTYLGGTFICQGTTRINRKTFSPGEKVQVLSYDENEFDEEILTIQRDNQTFEVVRSFFEKHFISMNGRGYR